MSIIIDGKEYYGIIYKIENTINNHVYIGQTTDQHGFNGRYGSKGKGIERVYNYCISRRSINLYYNTYLFRAIEKYGFDAFIGDEIFDTALTFDELNDKEVFYIQQFDSYHNGYNLTPGGDRRQGCEAPDSKNMHLSKRVCQIGLDGKLIKIWDSLGCIYRELGISKGSISNVCLGRTKTASGYVWVHEKDYDPNKDYSRIPRDQTKQMKTILLVDENNNMLREFRNGTEASEELGISKQEASKICLHQRKTPKYNLIYKDEYIEEQRLSGMSIAS